MHSPLPEDKERAPSVARLVRLVEKIVAESGNLENFDAARWTERWLDRPNAALGGRLPAELMQTEDGRQVVESIVARMQSGAYS
jgi:uncharacterized protein (DUF2384 family)